MIVGVVVFWFFCFVCLGGHVNFTARGEPKSIGHVGSPLTGLPAHWQLQLEGPVFPYLILSRTFGAYIVRCKGTQLSAWNQSRVIRDTRK